MEVKGHGGTVVVFDGAVVAIQRKGFLARSTIGKGEKRIPVQHITAVQLKPAGPLMNGFLQFSLGGANERRSRFGSQTSDAAKDENSVIFTKAQQPAFEQLRDAIEHSMTGGRPPMPQPTLQHAAPVQDTVGQLARLAELRQQGALTEQEFDAAKRQLLGGV